MTIHYDKYLGEILPHQIRAEMQPNGLQALIIEARKKLAGILER